MIIAVPLDNQAGWTSFVCDHFGSAPYFGIVDLETGTVDIISNSNSHHEHGQCSPISALSGREVHVVICNGIGGGAINKLRMMGIDVWHGGQAPTLEEAITRFKAGQLGRMELQHACQGH